MCHLKKTISFSSLILLLLCCSTAAAQCSGYFLGQNTTGANVTTLHSIDLTTGNSSFLATLDLPPNVATFGLCDTGESLYSIYNPTTGLDSPKTLIKIDYNGQITESIDVSAIFGNEGDLEYDAVADDIIVVSSENNIYRVSLLGSVTFLGTFENGLVGEDGPSFPIYGDDTSGMALDEQGNLIIAQEGQGSPDLANEYLKFFSIDLNSPSPFDKVLLNQHPITTASTVLGMTYNSCTNKINITYPEEANGTSSANSYLLEFDTDGSGANTLGTIGFNLGSYQGITGLTASPSSCDDVVIPDSQSRCSSDPETELFSLDLQDGGQGGTWSGSLGMVFEDENNPTTTVTGLSLGVNALTWFDNCTQQEYEVVITILDAPEVTLLADPSFTLCEGEFLTVTALPEVAGATYTFNRCFFPILANGLNNVYQAGPQFSGDIGVSVVYPNGCRTRTCKKVIRENCCDEVVIPEDMSFCEIKATAVELDILGTDGGQGGSWTASDQGVVFENPNEINTMVDEFEFGITTLSWSDNCTGETYSFDVEILQTIDLAITASPSTQPCEEDILVLSVPPNSGTSITWGLCGEIPLLENSLPALQSWSPNMPGVNNSYQAIVTLANGCEASDCIDIEWQDCECPEADQVDFPDISTCPGADTLCIDAPPGYIFIGVYIDGSDDNELNTPQSEYCFDDYGLYTVELQNAANGCTYTDDFIYSEAEGCCELFSAFEASTFTPELCQIISLTNNSTAGPGTQIIGYSWDFGNGINTSTEETPGLQVYPIDGTYTIELTVAGLDDQGNCCTSTTEQEVVVDCNCAVASSFDVNSNACDVDFNATSTTGLQTTIISYEWHMGDGTVLFGQNVDYTYSNSGDYEVTLITTGHSGSNTCTDQHTQTVSVTCEPTIVCDIDAQIDLSRNSVFDSFISTIEIGSGTTVLGYQWSINGADVGTDPNYSVFPSLSDGTYDVCLIVLGLSEGECCTQEFCETFIIGDPPTQENSIDIGNDLGSRLAPTIKLAPNPSKDHTQVFFQNLNDKEVIDLLVYDTNGKTVDVPIERRSDIVRIGTKSLATGTYIVMARTSTSLMTETLIVE